MLEHSDAGTDFADGSNTSVTKDASKTEARNNGEDGRTDGRKMQAVYATQMRSFITHYG